MTDTVLVFAPKYPPDTGGAALYFAQVTEVLQETPYRPVIVTQQHPHAARREAIPGGVVHRAVPRLGDRIYRGLQYLSRVHRLLHRYDPAVVHVHPHFPQWRWFRWLPSLRRLPVVYDCRDQTFTRRYVRGGQQYLSASREIDRILRDDAGASPATVTRSPVVVDTSGRETVALAEQRRHVAFVGDVEEHKGVRLAVQAVEYLNNTRSVRLHVAGGGRQADWVADRDSTAVRYHGEVAHARALGLLAACDAVVLPSRSEGRPRVVLEALSLGTPVVASPTGALPRMVGDAGVVVERDAAAIARGLETVLDDDGYAVAARDREYGSNREHVRTAVLAAYQQVTRGPSHDQT